MRARTQITLPPEIEARARRRAADVGVSLSEYIRRLVSRDIGEPQPKPSRHALFDVGSSGGSDIAKDKDNLIAEAFRAWRK